MSKVRGLVRDHSAFMAGKTEAQFPVGGVGWCSEGYGPAFAGELRS